MPEIASARLRNRVIAIGIACLDQLILWRDVKDPVASNAIADCQAQGGGMAATLRAAANSWRSFSRSSSASLPKASAESVRV